MSEFYFLDLPAISFPGVAFDVTSEKIILTSKDKIEEFDLDGFMLKFFNWGLTLGKLQKDLTSDDLFNFIHLSLNSHYEKPL